MINKSNVLTRRILTFPAIRPCESVSGTTLLDSLIDLSHTICNYKSNSFVTNKRKLRQLIRLIENLVIFFEELRNSRSKLSGATRLSLSELHFTFQKVYFLLEDCAREDARVWMLMKSDQVNDQFKVVIRAIGVAVDVMPMKRFDVSIEVKQLVDLVLKQAMKVDVKVESDDKRASDEIRFILSRFEGRVIPEPNRLRLVLEYLGIRKWSECSRQIKFLQEEIELSNSNSNSTNEPKDLEVLTSLTAFLIYCRCVVFNLVDSCQQANANTCSSEAVKCLNSDDFRCPISLEIMTDPVIISTGHTYDRASILKWFGDGNQTCPLTGEKLMCIDLVPNLALKSFITQYCLDNEIPVLELGARNRKTRDFSGSVAAEEAMKMLANFLVGKLMAETRKEINKAACEIRLLTKTSVFNRSCLVEAGVIPYLLNLLFSDDSLIQENAIAAILNLSKYSKTKRVIVEYGGLEMILNVVKNGVRIESRQHAAGALFYLASEEYRSMIGEIPETFPSLIELLKQGTDRGKKNALVAIFGLVQCANNHWRAFRAGVVPLLVNLIASSERDEIITDSLAILATLAEKLDGAMAILSTGGLHIIAGCLGSCDSRISNEYCVSLLLVLCVNGGSDVVQFLVKSQSIMGPLYSLLTGGTSRASKKASTLIRMLQEFNEKNSGGLRSLESIHVW